MPEETTDGFSTGHLKTKILLDQLEENITRFGSPPQSPETFRSEGY